jgi:hypothetical protein
LVERQLAHIFAKVERAADSEQQRYGKPGAAQTGN